jgi:hypothetical protein
MSSNHIPNQIGTWLNQMGLNFKSIRDAIVILYTLEGDKEDYKFGFKFPLCLPNTIISSQKMKESCTEFSFNTTGN